MNKLEAKTYIPRDQQYDLFKSTEIIVGVICLSGGVHAQNRNISFAANGINAILSELQYQHEYTTVDRIKKYKYCLLSLTSISDVETALLQINQKNKGDCKIIAGGQGCLSITPILDIVDIAVFGRAEGQINDIIEGKNFDNVYRKDRDFNFINNYTIRQLSYMVKGETCVGCKNKCLFCQYTWTRKHVSNGANYSHGKDLITPEEDWRGLIVSRSGRYTTAWDGLSECTRKKINKNISDTQITDKLASIIKSNYQSVVNLKIYNIVWYPWETQSSVEADIKNISSMLKNIDSVTGTRILIMFLLTPFSPEPLTPMYSLPANINVDSRSFFEAIGRQVYKGKKVEAFILPQINSGYTLAKRVLINRGIDGVTLKKIINIPSKLKAHEKVKTVSDMVDPAFFGYSTYKPNLVSYCKIPDFKNS